MVFCVGRFGFGVVAFHLGNRRIGLASGILTGCVYGDIVAICQSVRESLEVTDDAGLWEASGGSLSWCWGIRPAIISRSHSESSKVTGGRLPVPLHNSISSRSPVFALAVFGISSNLSSGTAAQRQCQTQRRPNTSMF